MYDIEAIRRDFPILSREVNGKPLVYLDNGASAQKPQVVIDAITRAYSEEYANVHRGLHYLSNLATEKYEGVRGIIARFLGVADEVCLYIEVHLRRVGVNVNRPKLDEGGGDSGGKTKALFQ